MNNIQNIFIRLLSYFCNDLPYTDKHSETELSELLDIADEQNLKAVVFYKYKKLFSMSKSSFDSKNSFLNNVFCDVNRRELLKEICACLEQSEIPFILMKGSVFRDYYPVPSLRTMGDIDLIIRPDDRDTVDDIFRTRMKFGRYIDNHAVWVYGIEKFYFEVHTHMFYEELTSDFDYIGYFDHIFEHIHHDKVFDIESDYLYVPDENYHFLYLMTHTAKHIINNGSGFRAYLDMVMFTKNNDSLDWNWIKNELERMNLLKFTETCFALCERWFDVKMPLPHKELDESFLEEITEKTFNDGVFGLDNTDNEGAHTAKEIKRENKGYWLTSIRLMIHLLFPPYEDMILAPWYSFLIGKRWLLPFAWIYRWIYCIIHKFSFAMGRLTEPFRIKEKIEKREDYISTWGL